MQKWLDLLTPSAAALSLLLAIALVVQAIRHGRAVRRLESRLAEREGAAARVSIDRLTQLTRRSGTSLAPSSTPRRDSPRLPPLGNVAAIAAVLALVLGTGWYLFIRDGGDSSAATSSNATTSAPATTTSRQPVAAANNLVPENPAPLPQSKGAYTVLVLNGSGVPRAAANMNPLVATAGYHTTDVNNATTTSPEKTSYVMYLPGKENVADNVAKDLGIKRRAPLDGVTVTQSTQDVDAIVIVGLDLARRSSP